MEKEQSVRHKHRQKLKELRDAAAKKAAEEREAGGKGMGVGGGDMGGLNNDPELMGAFQVPEFAAAFQDIYYNPTNIMKYQSNPKVMALISKLAGNMEEFGEMMPCGIDNINQENGGCNDIGQKVVYDTYLLPINEERNYGNIIHANDEEETQEELEQKLPQQICKNGSEKLKETELSKESQQQRAVLIQEDDLSTELGRKNIPVQVKPPGPEAPVKKFMVVQSTSTQQATTTTGKILQIFFLHQTHIQCHLQKLS